jgi:hypothetical protein
VGLSFLAVINMEYLLHRKPASAEISYISCGAQGYDTKYNLHIILNIIRLAL